MLFSVLGFWSCSWKLSNETSFPAVRSFSSVPGVSARGAAVPADPGWESMLSPGWSLQDGDGFLPSRMAQTYRFRKKKITSKLLS